MAKYLILVLSFLVTSCTTSQPIPTHTSIPPTHTSLPPIRLPQLIEVTFDGNECTVTGPTELPTGKHLIVYKDLSEKNVDFWVSRLLDGKTFQDLLDLQSEPGEYYPQPRWTEHPAKLGQAWDDSIGGEVYTFYLDKEGEYATSVGGYSPDSLWFCAPIWVIEAPSE